MYLIGSWKKYSREDTADNHGLIKKISQTTFFKIKKRFCSNPQISNYVSVTAVKSDRIMFCGYVLKAILICAFDYYYYLLQHLNYLITLRMLRRTAQLLIVCLTIDK